MRNNVSIIKISTIEYFLFTQLNEWSGSMRMKKIILWGKWSEKEEIQCYDEGRGEKQKCEEKKNFYVQNRLRLSLR